MESQQLIWYTHTHAKISWKYKTFANDDWDTKSIQVIDPVNEIHYCYGSNQYIMAFIEMLKERIIRYLPELDQVEIILGIFDKANILHRIAIRAYELICKVSGRETLIRSKDLYKSIITIIKYKKQPVFIGSICFNGID